MEDRVCDRMACYLTRGDTMLELGAHLLARIATRRLDIDDDGSDTRFETRKAS